MADLSDWLTAIGGSRRIGLDTNAVIYFLDAKAPFADLLAPLFRRCEAGEIQLIVPSLVEMELLVGPRRDGDVTAVERIGLLLDHFPNLRVVAIDRDAAQLAARLRAEHSLSTPDALIVAAAQVAGCDLVVGTDRQCAARLVAPRYLCLTDFVDL